MSTSQQRIVEALRMARERVEQLERMRSEPLAIVGMGCRFPQDVSNPVEFWNVLADGVDVTSEVPQDRWDVDGFFDPDPEVPGKMYVRRGGFLGAVDGFDPAFFGISEREAVSLDPQQRLLLEVSWEALEDAGIAPSSIRGTSTGVFMGVSWHDYERIAFGRDARRVDAYAGLGNTPSIAAGRISYVLGIEGPTMLVDTACSASLTAIHQACQSLRMGECDMALAGGVALMLSPLSTVFCCKIRALSLSGKCHTFDAAADGYLRGEGAGVIVLKRFSDARANGDRVLAVIRGTAINHDGASSGLTVPNGRAQERLLEAALKDAGVEPDAIDYVEAHGTGTPLGDPIELAALAKVYGRGRSAGRPLRVGSVKTNIGHLEAAAGVAGLIKVVLALQHQCIPASLNFRNPNPRFDWDSSPLEVPTHLVTCKKPFKLAGVSSFGFSGTNAHVILELASSVAEQRRDQGRGVEVLTLSARSEEALRALSAKYARFLDVHAELELAEICYTANAGRSAFEQRAAWVVRDKDSLIRQLQAFGDGAELPALHRGVYRNRRPRIAMLFTGQGAQYAGMGRELYERDQTFRAALDECTELLQGQLEADLLEVLYGSATDLLNRTDHTQPALFSLEYALRRTWESWGVVPQVVLGHSLGEYVAAQAAGVFSLADGLRLVVRRGQLMQQCCEAGAMMSVALEESRLRQELAQQGGGVVVAAVNGPSQLVVAGAVHEIEGFRERLNRQGVRTAVLPGSRAFHSPLVEPMLEEFGVALSQLALSPPKLALISNVSAELAGAEMATAQYWVEHTRAPVQFARSIESLEKQGIDILLEVGPRPTLVALARQVLAEKASTALTSLRPGRSDVEQMLESLAALQVRGAAVNWEGFYGAAKPRKVSLPTYPFQRKRYWVDDDRAEFASVAPNISSSGLGQRLDLAGAEAVFELRCSAQSHPFLKDHLLSGSVLAPGAFYISLALQACAELVNDKIPSVRDVVLSSPMRLDEDEVRVVQLVVSATGEHSRGFTIYSRSEGAWIAHATGALLPLQEPSAADQMRHDPDEPLIGQMSGSELRAQFASRGLEYGTSFQALSQVRFGESHAIAELTIPSKRELASGMLVHPGLLDAALQATAACGRYQRLQGAFVPLAFDAVVWHQRHQPFRPSRVTAHLDAVATPNSDTIQANLRIFSHNEEPLMEIVGMTLRRLEGRTQAISKPSEHVVEWVAVDKQDIPANPAGIWLLIGEPADRTAIGERLQSTGADVTIVAVDEDADRDTLLALLKNLPAPIRGVLRMASNLRGEADDSSRDTVARVCANIIDLATALAEMPLAPDFKLCLMTSGAHLLPGDLEPNSPAQSAVAALGRTIAVEYPELRCTNVDLPSGPLTSQCVESLCHELWQADGETDVCLRSRRYALRMRPAHDEDALPAPAAAFYRLAASSDGRIDSLDFIACERLRLAPREVEIQIAAAGLNFRDVLRALGKLVPAGGMGIGGECSGIVKAVGNEVTSVRVGDRVMAMADASFASHAAIDERYVAKLPPDWSFEAAATVPVAFLTAHYALSVLGRLMPGQSILIHAAATGVGLAAVQLARRLKLRVFATASAGKWAVLKCYGVEHICSSRTLDFSVEILAKTNGRGVDAVLNALTGDFIPASLRALGPAGTFLEMGKAEIWEPRRVAEHHATARYLPFDIAEVPAEQIAQLLQELMPMFANGELQPLPRTIYPARSARQAFRTMAQGRHIGKIVLRVANNETMDLPSGASYLVTGASGALGRKAAQWLASQGARHLILVARKANAAMDDLLTWLIAQGIEARFIPADMAVAEDVERLLDELKRGWPPLRGLLHAAGILDDSPLSGLDRERIARVLAAKLDGARLLHERTKHLSLDFYIVYSSVASVLGSAGQGNYAAANGFLDGMAQRRKSMGLPALSINWGAWEGSGMASAVDAATLRRWNEQGQFLLDSNSGMASLARAMHRQYAQVMVMAADWKRVGETRRTLPSLLRDIIQKTSTTSSTPGIATGGRARAADVRSMVERAVRKVAGTRAATRLDPHMPLREMGLDSLMAMELRNELCTATGLRLSPTIAFDYPCIEAIANHLLELGGACTADEVPTADPPAAKPTDISGDELLARLDKEISTIERHFL